MNTHIPSTFIDDKKAYKDHKDYPINSDREFCSLGDENQGSKDDTIRIFSFQDEKIFVKKLVVSRNFKDDIYYTQPFFNSIEQTKFFGPPLFTLLISWNICRETQKTENNTMTKLMPFYSGGSLESFSFPEKEQNEIHETKLKIIFSLLEGMKALHNSRVVHMDLKPTNVLFYQYEDEAGDFMWPSIDSIGFYVPFYNDEERWYAAPEIREEKNRKDKYSKACDIYSLGMVIYFVLVNGKKSKIERASKEKPNFDEDLNQYKDTEFVNMVFDMLNPEPKKRPVIDVIYQKFMEMVKKDEFKGDFTKVMEEYKRANEIQQKGTMYEQYFKEKSFKGETYKYNHTSLQFVKSTMKTKFSDDKIMDQMDNLVKMIHPAYKEDSKPSTIQKDRRIFDSLSLLFSRPGTFYSPFFAVFCGVQGKSASLLSKTVQKYIDAGYIARKENDFVLLNMPSSIDDRMYRESVEVIAVLNDYSVLNSEKNKDLLELIKKCDKVSKNEDSISEKIFKIIEKWYLMPKNEKEKKDIFNEMVDIMKSCKFKYDVSNFLITSIMDLERIRTSQKFLDEIKICVKINESDLVERKKVN